MPGVWDMTWYKPGVDPDNPGTDAFPLMAPPYRSVRLGSLSGATGPNFTPVTQQVPFQPGSVLKFVDVPDLEIDMRIIFIDTTEAYLWQHLAEAAPYFTPTKGLGWLEILNPSGNKRRIECMCATGLKIDPSSYKFFTVDAGLTFFAPYPYWLKSAATTHGTSSNPIYPWQAGSNNFFNILPLFVNFEGGKVYEFTAINSGDVNADMTMTFNGPLQDILITNQTIGNLPDLNFDGISTHVLDNQTLIDRYGTLYLKNYNLGVGTRLVIDFQNETVTEGVVNPRNRINFLTPNSTFFPLLPGENEIRIVMRDGSDQARLRVSWHDTYSTMY